MDAIEELILFHLAEMPVFLVKIALALVLGGMIGYEREAHGQAAGFRTNILVTLGACLMMHLSLDMEKIFRHLDESSVVRLDPGRIASYAIASMGFLGAGAIIKGKGTVRGLTTASGLWLVTGLGLAVGAGLFLSAIVTGLVSLLVLFSFRRFLTPFIKHDSYSSLSVCFDIGTDGLAEVRSILAGSEDTHIRSIGYHVDPANMEKSYDIRILSKENVQVSELISELAAIPGIKRLSWTQADVP